jgi:hypothetical protein
VDVREISIRKYKEYIYLGPDNYYACEVLPEDWIDILPSQRNNRLSSYLGRLSSIESVPESPFRKSVTSKSPLKH